MSERKKYRLFKNKKLFRPIFRRELHDLRRDRSDEIYVAENTRMLVRANEKYAPTVRSIGEGLRFVPSVKDQDSHAGTNQHSEFANTVFSSRLNGEGILAPLCDCFHSSLKT